jgi:hypothetical protein
LRFRRKRVAALYPTGCTLAAHPAGGDELGGRAAVLNVLGEIDPDGLNGHDFPFRVSRRDFALPFVGDAGTWRIKAGAGIASLLRWKGFPHQYPAKNAICVTLALSWNGFESP